MEYGRAYKKTNRKKLYDMKREVQIKNTIEMNNPEVEIKIIINL